jgi:hypothetical protein
VSIEDGRPVYLHAPSGRRIRFHYVGFLQAQFLPIECQLLLAGHVCGYRNPFADGMQMHVPSDTEIEHDPGVFYRQVCLRRSSWYVPTSLLRPLLHSGDSPNVAIALRRWFHTHLAPDELWFFRSHRSNRRGEKPRLLDLASPLSVNAFRHALAGGAKHVVLTRMAPGIAGLWRVNGESYVSELMVEV